LPYALLLARRCEAPRTEGPSCQVAAPGTEIALLESGPRTSFRRRETGTGGRASCSLWKGCIGLHVEQDREPSVCDRPARIWGRSPTLRGRGVFVAGNGGENGEDGSR